MGQAKAPDGYEIVPKDEYRKHKGDESLLLWSERVSRWHKRKFPQWALFNNETYARPIRKRTLWVPASERQPPVEKRVATRVSGGAWCGTSTCVTSATLPGSIEWLDLDAAEALEAERDRLAAQCAEHADRIAELEREVASKAGDGLMRAANDAVDQVIAAKRIAKLEADRNTLLAAVVAQSEAHAATLRRITTAAKERNQ